MAKALGRCPGPGRPGRRNILHLAPLQYHLDDAHGVEEPQGMFGDTLSLDLSVVTVEPPHLKNLALAIERAHLSVAGFVDRALCRRPLRACGGREVAGRQPW